MPHPSHATSRRGATALACFVLALTALPAPAPVDAQLLDERLVPGGRIRVSAFPSFTAWDQRFAGPGEDASGRIDLGSALSGSSALALYPGGAGLTDLLRSVSGNADYEPVTGPVHGRLTRDVTRIDLGLHLGITDWLTVGATVPRLKHRTMVDLVFMPDSSAADLGVNPAFANPAAVQLFLGSFRSAAGAAQARADALCAASDPGCAPAADLAARADGFESALRGAYGATPLFPMAGSAIAASLMEAFDALDAELQAAGIAGVATAPVLAGIPASEEDLAAGAVLPGLGYALPLASRTSLWAWGDTEVTLTARLLELGGGPGPTSGSSLRVLGGVLVRLGTGSSAHPDVPLDLDAGDGQTDVEGRIMVHATLGRAVGLRVGMRQGTQGERTVTRRVAPPQQVLAPVATRADLVWEPASYRGIEAEPSWRLTREFGLAGTWRYFTKGADVYRLLGSEGPEAGPDVSVLSEGSRVTTHVLGFGLTYDTVERWRAEPAVRPVQLHARFLKVVDGSGGYVPASVRFELGARLFARIPGLG